MNYKYLNGRYILACTLSQSHSSDMNKAYRHECFNWAYVCIVAYVKYQLEYANSHSALNVKIGVQNRLILLASLIPV